MARAPGRHPASDEELVRRIQQGEVGLFSIIFERHYGRLAAFARQLGVPEDEREDVLAETFTRAFSRIQSFDPDAATRYVSYLYAVARNLVTDRLRRRGRGPDVTLLEDLASEPETEEPEPLFAVLRSEEIACIREAMERLSPSDREIITLSYDQELSCREIMEVMGKPSITAVTTHLYKAMKRLRSLVLSQEPASRSR